MNIYVGNLSYEVTEEELQDIVDNRFGTCEKKRWAENFIGSSGSAEDRFVSGQRA